MSPPEFFLPPLLVLLPLAIACGLCGVVLAARSQTMLPDALSHAILPGIVVVAVLQGGAIGPLGLVAGAVGASLVAMAMIEGLERLAGASRGAALATTYPVMLSLGLVLMAVSGLDGTGFDPHSILFGSLDFLYWPEAMALLSFDWIAMGQALGVAPLGFIFAVAALLLSVIGFGLANRGLAASIFDPLHFRRQAGARALVLHVLIIVTVTAAAVGAFLTVGAIMAVALFAAPALGGRVMAKSLMGWLGASALLALGFVILSYGALVIVPEVVLPLLGLWQSSIVLGVSLAGSYAVVACVAALALVALARRAK